MIPQIAIQVTLKRADRDLRIRGALGATRTPNLLIRGSMPRVWPMRRNPYLQVSSCPESGIDAIVRYRPVSP
jgi:hypothetical protein